MSQTAPPTPFKLGTFSAAGCNIDVVLIDTEGRRAIDVFYVASDGRKIAADLQRTVEKRILAVC